MGAESKAELQLNVNFNIHLDLPSGPFVTYTLTADGMSMAVKGGSDRPAQHGQDMMQPCAYLFAYLL